ncbi:hypothetical protein ABET09_28535 [Priestia megaterium]
MKKFVRPLLTIVGISSMLFAYAPNSSAAGNVIEEDNAVYDESINAYVVPLEVQGDQLVPTSPDKYEASTGNDLAVKESTIQVGTGGQMGTMDYREYWKYTPKSKTKVVGKTKRASSDITCTTATCNISKQVSATVTASFSTQVAAEKSAIKANAGFNWSNAATDSSTYGFTLKKGQKGYIGFKPYYNKTSGTLKKYSNWDGYLGISKPGSGQSPQKTKAGEAVGNFYFVFIKK